MRSSRAGVTLVESVISTVIVGVMLAAALTAVGAASRTRLSLSERQQGAALAYELMTEVIATHFEDPDETPGWGPEPSEGTSARVDFDDVDDYVGWSASPPHDARGNVLPGLTGWTRSVTVTWADPVDPKNFVEAPSDLKRITVSVTDPRGRKTTLEALRSPAGPLEQPGSAGRMFTSWMGTEIQIGADHASGLLSGTALLNAPAAATQNLLINPGFEEGAVAPWGVYGGTATLNATTTNPHSGAYRLEVTGRSSKFAVPGQDVTDRLVNGATYEAEVWVRMDPSQTDDIRIALQLDSTGDGVVTLASPFEWIPGPWQKLELTVTPTWSGTLTSAHIQFETRSGSMGFRIDDARLSEVP
jgi:type II secretory pathway pseudopilin PulG